MNSTVKEIYFAYFKFGWKEEIQSLSVCIKPDKYKGTLYITERLTEDFVPLQVYINDYMAL